MTTTDLSQRRRPFKPGIDNPGFGSRNRDPGIEIALEAAGGTGNLAKFLKITPAAISQWPLIPLRHVPLIEERYSIPREEQRPDIYPPGRRARR